MSRESLDIKVHPHRTHHHEGVIILNSKKMLIVLDFVSFFLNGARAPTLMLSCLCEVCFKAFISKYSRLFKEKSQLIVA